jgi:very-short-patch-repair endonuclease
LTLRHRCGAGVVAAGKREFLLPIAKARGRAGEGGPRARVEWYEVRFRWDVDREDPWKIAIARRLRREATDAERRLWQRIRGFRDAHWRRQRMLLGYLVDFYSSKARLVVEVDGGQHFELRDPERDSQRDEALARIGVRVLRYDNATVLGRTTEAAEEIWRIWNERKR